MRWRKEEGPLSTEESFQTLTLDSLKPMAALLAAAPPHRKNELVAFLTTAMQEPQRVRDLYEKLEPLEQAAVQEAAHDPKGWLHADRFRAKYERLPSFNEPPPKGKEPFYDYGYGKHSRPKTLALFFPHYHYLPTDLRRLLLAFVPAPGPFVLATSPEPPARVPMTRDDWEDTNDVSDIEEIPVRIRETAREAAHDVMAVLRLIELGRVRVSDKKRQPTAAARKAVADVLQGGDFYTPEDQAEYKDDPAGDLTIKAFAWPMIVQAAGLAEKTGDNLRLTPAGRKALTRPAHEILRAAWKKWLGTTLLDEFSRVEAIKGQSKGQLSALTTRRKTVLDGLAQCPPGEWVGIEDFFRFLIATDRDFVVARQAYNLYIAEHYYGNLGYEGEHLWEMLQGRYILIFLFEYAASLGLIDVAYLPPQGVRDDFRDHWGTDDYSCLSRYDGLQSFRVNPLGAWCLDLAERYEAPPLAVADVLQVLPNLDVVAKRPPLDAADRLVLERFAEQESDAVWRLTAAKILPVLEQGGSLHELAEFLAARAGAPLPQTVQVFLDDLRRRAGQLRDVGLVRLVECADGALAQMLVNDPQLRGKCQLAGERGLVFRAADEAAMRKALRRLGYLLPPQSS